MMWPFKHKKTGAFESQKPCTYCGSLNTKAASPHRPDKIRVWRGQRFLTCSCLDCKRDFYIEEPAISIQDEGVSNEAFVDNKDELEMAEEEIKRQIEENGDHMCR